jgi:hypothetical protein
MTRDDDARVADLIGRLGDGDIKGRFYVLSSAVGSASSRRKS